MNPHAKQATPTQHSPDDYFPSEFVAYLKEVACKYLAGTDGHGELRIEYARHKPARIRFVTSEKAGYQF